MVALNCGPRTLGLLLFWVDAWAVLRRLINSANVLTTYLGWMKAVFFFSEIDISDVIEPVSPPSRRIISDDSIWLCLSWLRRLLEKLLSCLSQLAGDMHCAKRNYGWLYRHTVACLRPLGSAVISDCRWSLNRQLDFFMVNIMISNHIFLTVRLTGLFSPWLSHSFQMDQLLSN